MTHHVMAGIPFELNARGGVCHLKTPGLPQFRFEWHPDSGRVYVIRTGVDQQIGEPLSEGVKDERTARRVVQLWVGGYQTRCRELN